MLNNFLREKNKGFTLIELMIVIAIVGVLAAIAVPQFTGQRNKASNLALKTFGSNLYQAMRFYYTDHNAYPKSLDGGNYSDVLSTLDSSAIPEESQFDTDDTDGIEPGSIPCSVSGIEINVSSNGEHFLVILPSSIEDGSTTTMTVYVGEKGTRAVNGDGSIPSGEQSEITGDTNLFN